MNYRFRLLIFILIACIPAAMQAQATRTWVSGVGDDVNPCSRTAPCKTWAGAISKTAAGGEINAIDPGGYGALTITKSITIDGGGTQASTLAAGTQGFIINALTTDRVIIRNVSINGASTGTTGINILKAKSVRIDNVHLFGFSGRGVDIQPTTANPLSVSVTNSVVRNNNGIGIVAGGNATAAGQVQLAIHNSMIEGNGSHGVWVTNGNKGVIFDSSIYNNTIAGLITTSNNTRAAVHMSSFLGNAQGVQSGNGIVETTVINLSSTVIVGNTTGVNISGGTVESALNNTIRGNTTNVAGGALGATGAQ